MPPGSGLPLRALNFRMAGFDPPKRGGTAQRLNNEYAGGPKYAVAEKHIVSITKQEIWRGVRVVEGARLESVYTATYRGFESLSLRHIINDLDVFRV